jgi:uncharacterized HAD superfamily protein
MKVIKDIDSFITDMEIDKIFLDIDGVIFHSYQAMIDILNERYDGNFDGSDVTSWNFQCCYRGMTSEEIESMFNNGLFFKVVKPIDGALEFMDRYRDKIILVTKANIENYALKRKWFDDRGFKDIPMIALPLNVSKGFINMDNINEYSLFIDDSTQNLIDCNADYKVQMREYCDDKEREWQKGWNGLVMYKW